MPTAASVTHIGKSTTSLYDAANRVYATTMSFDEFAALEKCPNQRNGDIRTNKAHLKTFSPAMRTVAVAILPSGRMFKVDGHSRVKCVSEGRLLELKDEPLITVVHSVDTLDEIKRIYKTYDNRGASKNAADEVTSAFRELKMNVKSDSFVKGNIGSALRNAVKAYIQYDPAAFSSRNPDRTEQVAFFKDAILAVDALNPQRSRFNQGICAAAFLAYKKHGMAAKDFFEAYNNTSGLEDGPTRNAVRMLHEIRNKMKKAGRVAGQSTNDDQMANTLACFNRHLSNPSGFWEKCPSPVRPIDFLNA